jgi:hypothetical protein
MHRAVKHGLNDMRAAGYPGGLPPLLHLIRSVAGNFLDSSPDMRPLASSLITLCEKSHEPRKRRIVFSIVVS